MRRLIFIGLVVSLGWGSPGCLGAAEFVVDRQVDSLDALAGDGACADAIDGGCSLRAAIIEANALPGADRIVLAAGTYLLTVPGRDEDDARSGDIDVLESLELIGAGSAVSIVDAGAIDSIIEVFGGAMVRLQGITLRNGQNDRTYDFSIARGIGLTVHEGANVQIADLAIRDQRSNSFSAGLGIGNGGCLRGERLRILDNGPTSGLAHALSGGIVTRGASSCLELIDVEISGNAADQAGAIYATAGAALTLRRALISDNEARFSGAMTLNGQNDAVFENVTISGNRGAGVILNDGNSQLRLLNSTITRNAGRGSAPQIGGIVDVHAASAGRLRLTNTILAGNGPGSSANDCNHVASDGGGNIIGTVGCAVSGTQSSDRLDVDPQLGDLVDLGGFTRVHAPGVAAIDTGVDAECLALDQRGATRPQDGDEDGVAHCDIGAMEFPGIGEDIFEDGFEPLP